MDRFPLAAVDEPKSDRLLAGCLFNSLPGAVGRARYWRARLGWFTPAVSTMRIASSTDRSSDPRRLGGR